LLILTKIEYRLRSNEAVHGEKKEENERVMSRDENKNNSQD
jgi:hypothetical protein